MLEGTLQAPVPPNDRIKFFMPCMEMAHGTTGKTLAIRFNCTHGTGPKMINSHHRCSPWNNEADELE